MQVWSFVNLNIVASRHLNVDSHIPRLASQRAGQTWFLTWWTSTTVLPPCQCCCWNMCFSVVLRCLDCCGVSSIYDQLQVQTQNDTAHKWNFPQDKCILQRFASVSSGLLLPCGIILCRRCWNNCLHFIFSHAFFFFFSTDVELQKSFDWQKSTTILIIQLSLGSFSKQKCQTFVGLQLLRCEDFQFFFAIHDGKLNIFQ